MLESSKTLFQLLPFIIMRMQLLSYAYRKLLVLKEELVQGAHKQRRHCSEAAEISRLYLRTLTSTVIQSKALHQASAFPATFITLVLLLGRM